VLILLLLQAAFRSTRLAMLMFMTLPVALVGGALAAWVAVGTISLGALVGFFAVLGIAARNGILMISHFQHLERVEGEEFGVSLVVRGASERLSPILMTALATALALAPLVVYGSRPGQEIENPMALVILGGLATSTLMNLFVVPALYLRYGRGESERRGEHVELGLRKRRTRVEDAEREPVGAGADGGRGANGGRGGNGGRGADGDGGANGGRAPEPEVPARQPLTALRSILRGRMSEA
jgi:predicted RND superfamily exporter protein